VTMVLPDGKRKEETLSAAEKFEDVMVRFKRELSEQEAKEEVVETLDAEFGGYAGSHGKAGSEAQPCGRKHPRTGDDAPTDEDIGEV